MELLTGTAGHDRLDVATASTAYEIRGLVGSDVIYGSAFGDLIVGGPGADQMFGNAGDDVFLIEGSDVSSDIVYGGDGTDTIQGGAGNDVFVVNSISSVERIDGGGGIDILRGSDQATYWTLTPVTLTGIFEIDGAGGGDQIVGSAGNDRIRGGAGNDTLDGGAGIDTAVYSGDFALYTLTNMASGQLRIATTANIDGTDLIRNFEIVEFANGTYANGVFTPAGDPTNTAPAAAADGYAATEDVALVMSAAGVLGNDLDPDGDTLTVSSFDAVSAHGGAVAMSANGGFTYTPKLNFNGSDTFSYTAADGRGGFSTAIATITVSAVNDAPVAVNNSYTGTKDTAFVVNAAAGVLANDTDAEGDALTVASFDATSAHGGAIAMDAQGSFTYTPPAGYTGTDSFSYTATDGTGQSAATVNLTINAPGSGLTLLTGTTGHDRLDVSTASSAYEIHGLVGSDVIYGSAFGDLIVGGQGSDQMFGNGGDDVFLIVGSDPFADTVYGDAGFDTILGSTGNDVFLLNTISSIERIDGGGGIDILRGSDQATNWTLTQTTLIGISEIDGGGGGDQIVGSAGNDRIRGGAGNDTLDGGAGIDTAVYSGDFALYTLTNMASGQLRIATTANTDGTDLIKNFEIVEFANGTYANGVFTPSGDPTNTAPAAAADGYGTTEDVALVMSAAGVLGNDLDPDGDTLTVSSFDAVSAHGGAVAMSANGGFTYTPKLNFNGSDTFSYTAADGRGGFSTAIATITVSAVNDAPVAVNNSYTATLNTALVVAATAGVLANDSDPDGDVLTVGSFDGTSAHGGIITMDAQGSFTYTPPAGYTGTDSFAYTATDGTGQSAATVNLTINAPGSGLTLLTGTANADRLDVSTASMGYEIRGLAGLDSIYGSPFDDLIVGGAGADNLFGNAGNDVFLFSGADASFDTVYGGDGLDTIQGSAGNDIIGVASLSSIERIDGGGGIDILRGSDQPTYWTLTSVTLTGIFEIDGAGSGDQIVGSAGNDRIRGGAGNDTLDGGAGTDTAVYSGNFGLYTITDLGGGQLRIATTANSDGTDTIKNFEIIEFANGTYSNGIFTDPTNTAPLAAADAYAATEDVTLVINAAAGVLGNDTDPDGDTLTVSSFDAVSGHGGTVAMGSNGSFSYKSALDYNGSDSFSYIVRDGRGGFSTATATITVSAVNDAPVAVNNTYAGTKDTAFVISAAAGVLTNDHDPDGNALSVSSYDTASVNGGTIVMDTQGSFIYTPPAGYTGTDSFSYFASDGAVQDSATVSLIVLSSPTTAFESIIRDMPENEWRRLNVNKFQDVWTPAEQRPYALINGRPLAIIDAWSAATWDTNRSEYIFWGGGHANYEGNEVYTWSAATLQWERASLPSNVINTQYGVQTTDGYVNSPMSSHAYDNLEFLEVADRMINFGGASAGSGGPFVEPGGPRTGPYFWDPSKADPNKVGGLTGSQVNPTQFPNVVGGEMWENRQTLDGPEHQGHSMVSGTTDYARINGVDVVFVNDTHSLWKYTVPDVDDASQDTWEILGTVWDTYSGPGAGAYDPGHNMYVRTSGTEFTYWDLDFAGAGNRNVGFVPTDASGQFTLSQLWGMEYDPVREHFVLWKGDASVWYLDAPEQPSAFGWTLTQAPAPAQAAPVAPPGLTGIYGKWDYIEKQDIFIGVADPYSGDVWAYKPAGWTPPVG